MLIKLDNISKFFGSRLLFENISFEIAEGEKIGFIGENGIGKTTLIKIMTGEISYDDGTITKNNNLKIGYLSQQAPEDKNTTVFDEVLSAYPKLIQLEKQIEDVTLDISLGSGDAQQLAELLHKLSDEYEKEGGFVYKSLSRSTLIGLGFAEEDFSKKLSMLSGGEKTRVMLAKLLLSDCNLLLLDEPTNHLDIQSVEWFENFLVAYKGACLAISHDRYFLDKVTTKTFELFENKIYSFSGSYSVYQQKRTELFNSIEKKYQNTMQEIERIERIIKQQRAWNRERNIRTAESKQNSIDRLAKTLVAPPSEHDRISFEFRADKTGGNDVVVAENVSVSYDGTRIFDDVSFTIKRGERIFLLGANGCGKSSLFKAILGILEHGGSVRLGSNISVGYYDQHQSDLDPAKTIFDEIYDCYPDKTITEIRNACAAFLFYGDDVFKKISTLSGGEKARVSLIKLMMSGSNFLMLDEPTNHLDISSKEALENSFAQYSGTMFIVSHDRYFINLLADKIFYMDSGGITEYLGNYDYYLSKKTESTQETVKEEKPNSYKLEKEERARIRRLQNSLLKTEENIEKIEAEIARLQELLLTPEIATDYAEAVKVSGQLDDAKKSLDSLMEEWEKINLELDGKGEI
ncbi:MAG: ABC-F family ATP-binding cassette domain-containing protein [Monoglobales bacterium]